jgi:molybdopterin molybdotransferase
MLTPQQALALVTENAFKPSEEIVPLRKSIGRILSQNVYADRDFPPFDRVSMDGIAINYEATKATQVFVWIIEDIQFAGQQQKKLRTPSNCLEVMTGAVLPQGTDTVIRYEDLEIVEGSNKTARLKIGFEQIKPLQNVHKQGIDRQKNELLIQAGVRVSPAEVAVMASVGCADVWVKTLPKVALVSTGDELVDVHETPEDHQIRRSNSYMLAASLAERGIEAKLFHLNDIKEEIEDNLSEILQQFDVLILSGGVSEGKADFVPEVLEKLSVKKYFHKVAQRPGKPFWFGKSPTGALVFALPGNPVSTFLCFYKYVLAGIGLAQTSVGILAEDIMFEPNLVYFLPVSVQYNTQGQIVCSGFKGSGSGDYANLLRCSGFLELPAERTAFKAGESFSLILFR